MTLPKTIDPIKLSKQGMRFHGDFLLNQCARLQAICDQESQIAKVELEFNTDHVAHVPFISGTLKATLKLICQRCNAPMLHEFNITFLLSPVLTETNIDRLPEKYEPLIVHNESVLLAEMLEDEILLALPMVAKHEKCDGLY